MGDKKPSGGKKRPSSGKNKTPRTPVQMPKDWLAVARSRAQAARQPVLWYLITLIESDARQAGVTDLPVPPWDKESSGAKAPDTDE